MILLALTLVLEKVRSQSTNSKLELNQILNLQNSGGIGCVLIIHTEVESCKNKFQQRVTSVVEEGNTMDSEEYRKAMCCGFWSLRDCVAESARKKCDKSSAETISRMKIYSPEQENVFYTKCDGYEYGSKHCGNASQLSISIWTLITAFTICLIKHYCN